MDDDSSPGRIATELRSWVREAPPGARLPSTRTLVARHHASPVTVQRALRILTDEGLVEAHPGIGTFVRSIRTAAPADFAWQTAALRAPLSRISTGYAALRSTPNDVIALHAGYPDPTLLPERLVRAALGRAARSEAATARAPAAGLPELQSWFARDVAASTPAHITPPSARDVIILPGTQSGLSSLFRTLVTPGGSVLLESPTYWGAIVAAQQAAVTVVPVPSGPQGPDPQALDRAFGETGARVFYAQPNFANPTGAQWPVERHQELLDIVQAHGAFLIEDDWAHDFGITTDAVPLVRLDDSGHVIHLRSLTKSMSPAVRVGAMIARGPARDRILADRSAESMYVSSLLQVAALDVVSQPGWHSHRRGLRELLRSRRDLLVSALAEHAPQTTVEQVPSGGLNLWVRLPDDTDVPALVQRCEAAGLVVADGAEWFPAEPAGPYLRLNYSGPDPGAFPAAARILGTALAGA
jgi:DNA-binding transcriptional MocR family regulator